LCVGGGDAGGADELCAVTLTQQQGHEK
jgi:hypothetical protein